ncbi:hypothetical protein PAXINDRAFT_19420 [Paxillus involutus ATCC 200175]|uniref:Uncharacterized protein n=1 Tax=Paxillus involutus ATCC 200175 TaxID=664439 RepID=A0A0C9TJ70_PAXIN|nr:hypothetical protein PAXINDRAFT_19420 [Paxillus involutus ATCC 200175]
MAIDGLCRWEVSTPASQRTSLMALSVEDGFDGGPPVMPYTVGVDELSCSKLRGKADDNIIAEITRLESALTVTKDDLSTFKLRYNGTKDELKHVERELKRLVPNVKKAQNAHSTLTSHISALQSVIDEAEHSIFASFCAKIGVGHIQEYEEHQLKVAEKKAKRDFGTISKLHD